MKVSATELKNKLGQYLETAIKETVFIEKNGRLTSALVSYDRLKQLLDLEDEMWSFKALEAKKEGFLGIKASHALLKELEKKIK